LRFVCRTYKRIRTSKCRSRAEKTAVNCRMVSKLPMKILSIWNVFLQ
jgi:hypothetical protein